MLYHLKNLFHPQKSCSSEFLNHFFSISIAFLFFCAWFRFSSLFDLYSCYIRLLLFIVRQTASVNSKTTPNCWCFVYACFRSTTAEFNSCDRNHIAQKTKSVSFTLSLYGQTLILGYKLFKARDLVSFFKYLMNGLSQV